MCIYLPPDYENSKEAIYSLFLLWRRCSEWWIHRRGDYHESAIREVMQRPDHRYA